MTRNVEYLLPVILLGLALYLTSTSVCLVFTVLYLICMFGLHGAILKI